MSECASVRVCTHSVFSFVNMRKLLCFMVWRWQYMYAYIVRWQWSTVECTVNAVKMLNEINNSINIMCATSFDEKCKTLNIKPGWIFPYRRALGARIHVIIHGIEYSGDEFLNEPHIFCRLAPLFHSFIPSRYSMYTLFYYPSAGSDPAPLPSLKNEQTATEWMRKRNTQAHPNTRNLPWSEFDSQIEWL